MLVFLATFVILILFQPLLKKFGPQPPAKPPETSQPAPQQTPATAPPPSPAPAQVSAPSARGKSSKTPATPAVPTKQAETETETVIESDLYKITFTNRGGQAKSWILKKYSDDKGQPLDLVHQIAAQQYGYPLSLYAYDENLRKKLNSALYLVTQSGKDITFEFADADSTVRKTIHLDDTYVAHVDVTVTQNGQSVQALPSWPSGFGDQTVPASYAVSRIDYHPLYPGKKWWGGTKDVERLDIKHVSGGATIRDPFYWAGSSSQYFGAVFLPDDPKNSVLVTLRNPLQVPANLDKPDPNDTVHVEILGAAVGDSSGHTSLRLFAGPKNLQILESIRATPVPGLGDPPNLSTLLDLGMFGFIVKPLFLWLRWTHDHWVANWGWSIIILTVIINLALLPLRLSSMKSALKTAKIQPQIKAIREKYSKIPLRDPRRAEANQKIQQETAALMKEHGVNPVGGCLPMLIQFPFLIAFYTMLGNSTELRHASWLYIKDLSGPDPYHILPIGIVITTFLVQKMTPQGGMDPQQQKMMNLMMPVMLGFISWKLSAGLCLYWTVGNLVAMLMQVALNRTELGREQKELAAKRARKASK
jgi:YidC/Oxa1 family membrane protein insertase